MNLTAAEKLIIELLCDCLKGKESEYDVEFLKNAIGQDMTWAIPFKYETLNEGLERPRYVQEVFAILETYRWIHDTSRTLGADFTKIVESIKGDLWVPPTFDGFDGNNESAYLGASKMIVDDLARYQEQTGNTNNTHAPRLDAYIRTANAYMKLRIKTDQYYPPQTEENLKEVFTEASKRYLDQTVLNAQWLRD